jgi:hypothetical protein
MAEVSREAARREGESDSFEHRRTAFVFGPSVFHRSSKKSSGAGGRIKQLFRQLQFAGAAPIFGDGQIRVARPTDDPREVPFYRTVGRFLMASRSTQLRIGLQVVLAAVILGLSYYLYYSITEPYDRIERQQQLTERTRARMTHIRRALVDYERDSTSFPDSLSLLLDHVRRDSTLLSPPDSAAGDSITLDSLLYSPRTGTPFQYTVSDTGRVETYLLEDPDTDDKIGTLSGDPTKTNAASWE